MSRNTYRRYREPSSSLQTLNKMKKVTVSGVMTLVSRSGTRRELTATFRNQGAAVAAMVRLSLLDEAGGRRVLPTLYSDNRLWLLPGESRTVHLSWPSRALTSPRPALRAEAYNSDPSTVRP